MNYTYQVLTPHPRQNQFEVEALMVCLRALADCAQSCATCANACLNEPAVDELIHCIRLNFNCADVCLATARLLSGLTGVNVVLWRSQLQACLIACQVCSEACSRHAAYHKHCRVCAEACRQSELACHNLLATLTHL
ncbi:MAG: four-helix bundle copper-binding protein [Anaerolineae bacterium]|nr:four-helix bundle copper-binding protein [Anaerolineae bacterium]